MLNMRMGMRATLKAIAPAAGAWTGVDVLKASGEGSRGGKVIGHTRSGKPIYEHRGTDPAHPYRAGLMQGWSSLDHRDAAETHWREAERHERIGDAARMWHHRTHADYNEGHAHRLGQEERAAARVRDDDEPVTVRPKGEKQGGFKLPPRPESMKSWSWRSLFGARQAS